MEKRSLSLVEAADSLGLSRAFVRQEAERGALVTSMGSGGRRFVIEADLSTWHLAYKAQRRKALKELARQSEGDYGFGHNFP